MPGAADFLLSKIKRAAAITSQNESSLIDSDDPLGLTAMTSEEEALLMQTDDPLAENAFPKELRDKWREERKQVRQLCAEEYSSSPLWRARAEKDPDYWNKFSPGGIR